MAAVTVISVLFYLILPIPGTGTTYLPHQKTVYVLPTTPPVGESPSLCPTGLTHCYTLSEISSRYTFESNTALVLLPGTHTIAARNDSDSAIHIIGVRNFSIIGRTSTVTSGEVIIPRIECFYQGTFQIHISLTSNLLLGGFEITGCSANYVGLSQLMETVASSVKIEYSSNVTIKEINVNLGGEAGLFLDNVYKQVIILDSIFSNNSDGNCVIFIEAFPDASDSDSDSVNLTIINTELNFGDGSDFYQSGLTVVINTAAMIQIHLINVTLYDNNLFLKLNVEESGYMYINMQGLNSTHTANTTKNWLMGLRTCSVSGLLIHTIGSIDTIIISDSHLIGACLTIVNSVKGHVQMLHLVSVTFKNSPCNCTVLPLHNFASAIIRNVHISNSTESDSVLEIVSSNVTFQGECSFEHNGGGIIVYSDSILAFGSESKTNFLYNRCSAEDATHVHCSIFEADSSKINAQQNSQILFENNTGTSSGVLTLHRTTMNLWYHVSMKFYSNVGTNGGAISLYAGSRLNIIFLYSSNIVETLNTKSWIYLLFVNNHATGKGGAIYIDGSGYTKPFTSAKELKENAAIVVNTNATQRIISVGTLSFINNTADDAGSAIYGGWIECFMTLYTYANIFLFYGERGLSRVSSNPVRVCLCFLSRLNCTISQHTVETYPGRTLNVSAVAVGQQFGTVPAIVHARLIATKNKAEPTLPDTQYVQEVRGDCTTLYYTMFSVNQVEMVELTVDKHNVPNLKRLQQTVDKTFRYQQYNELGTLMKQLTMTIKFKPCPVGFSINHTLKRCSCHPTLMDHQINDCNIETLTILKPSQKWINATFTHTEGINITDGVIVHDHCPFDYCKQNTPHISLDMDHPDDQCDFNRSGILCGACQTNFSHVFGTSRCNKCSNLWALLIVPAIALLGIALVILLISINLTVSIGMINGLIFYANIVRANHAIFFHSNTFLSKLIAWLNLDLGFEVCFYNGLDAYSKTWLQFLFPVYIWALVWIIIILSHHYTFAARLSGTNAVQVLATLFLLSYAKLIRTIITILQPTILVYPDGFQRRVWLYDGNVDYLKGKHIPLFIVALLVLVCLSIPYTTSLLFIHWLRKYNHHRLLRWVGKLKPLFDAYTGPLKERHCYWFGLLLLVRVALYTVFSLNVSGNTSVNLMAIGTTTSIILSYLSLVGGVYESWLANLMLVSFLLNLTLLTMGTHFYGNTQTISATSVGIAFGMFAFIVLYHIYLRVIGTRRGKQINETLKSKLKQLFSSQNVIRDILYPTVVTPTPVSHSSIRLQESLLGDN